MQQLKELRRTCRVRMMSAATSKESLEGLAKHLASPVSSAVQASLLGAGRSALNTCNSLTFSCSLHFVCRQQTKHAPYKMCDAAGSIC